ncbi:unnamed protein product [Cylicocyclus nassatus]|uniref:Uncharacterized protein n=1 Tax=Cylicocyclus nassatus TaxID=53992 RepID=A0AA36MFK1_CYLNA|nr:unnamed protein product [Cylicocyclus nassatus]
MFTFGCYKRTDPYALAFTHDCRQSSHTIGLPMRIMLAIVAFVIFCTCLIEAKKPWEHSRFSSVEKGDFFHGIPHNVLAVREGRHHRSHADHDFQARRRPEPWQRSRGHR